jgi:hypothetical protein
MVVALDESKVRAYIELILILACHLKQNFLLTKKSELVFEIGILWLLLELEAF